MKKYEEIGKCEHMAVNRVNRNKIQMLEFSDNELILKQVLQLNSSV